jgi:NAD-dependent SIR2 family protein deacetylase
MVSQAESTARVPLEADFERASDLLRGRRLAVLTGAGVSTDSGIPDYRGKGASKRTPMTWQQFRADADYRKRYWAGSQLGWASFGIAEPNAGHLAIAQMEAAGVVSGVVTQNVDGLHARAGSQHVVDLHGSMDKVRCMNCGQYFARDSIAEQLVRDNPGHSAGPQVIGPDGDVIPGDLTDFRSPVCSVCGGMLRPDIVFFGEFVPADKFAVAKAIVGGSDALVIAGSSLVVNSGIRLLEVARRRKLPIVIINVGETRGDERAAVKLDAGTSETLQRLADRLIAS